MPVRTGSPSRVSLLMRRGRLTVAVLYPLLVGGVCAAFALSLPQQPNFGWVLTALFTLAAIAGAFAIARPSRTSLTVTGPPPIAKDAWPELCPKCGAPVYEGDRDTSTGRDVRSVFCSRHCGWTESYDISVALWKAMAELPKASEAD